MRSARKPTRDKPRSHRATRRNPLPAISAGRLRLVLPDIIDMPGWRPIVKRAATTVLTVSLLPMAVFYASLSLFGLRTAVLTTVGWYYAGLLLKIVRRKPVVGAAMVGAGLLSIRALITFLTGSAFIHFLQPVAGTVATATVFAATATALAGRRSPVAGRRSPVARYWTGSPTSSAPFRRTYQRDCATLASSRGRRSCGR
jgi:hypothetical protein